MELIYWMERLKKLREEQGAASREENRPYLEIPIPEYTPREKEESSSEETVIVIDL